MGAPSALGLWARAAVRQDHVEKGRRAGQMLIAHLEGREPLEPVVLPTQLIVRESSGPPPRP